MPKSDILQVVQKTAEFLKKNIDSFDKKSVNAVKRALSSGNPEPILSLLQANGELGQYKEYYHNRMDSDYGEIRDKFSDKSRPIIELLIDQHIIAAESVEVNSQIDWGSKNEENSISAENEKHGASAWNNTVLIDEEYDKKTNRRTAMPPAGGQ